MDVNQLHYFRTIVEQGSLNKASEILYISRQGLSKIMKKMENELGAQLFDITGTGVVPTVFGQALYQRSEDYIRFHQNFLTEVDKMKLNPAHELNIGLQSGFSEGFGKDFLANFIIQNPDLSIRVRSYTRERIIEAMDQKDIPIWIAAGHYNDAAFHPVYTRRNKLFLLAAQNHPLARQEKVYLNDLTPYPLIGLTHDIGQKGRTEAEINRNKLKTPDFYLNASDRNLIMKLVQSGLAVSFNAGWQYTEYPGIVALPLADLEVEVEVHALIRKDVAANEPVKRFLDYLKAFNA